MATARLGPPRPEESLDDLNALVAPYVGIAIVALAVACVVLLVAVVVLARRTSRLDRRIAAITRGSEGSSLESILDAHLDKVYSVARDLDELGARTAVVEVAQRRALQRTGLVRFNPFEDTGGNQSFALAILDAQGNGIVVSSLHSRTGRASTARRSPAGARRPRCPTRRGRRSAWPSPPGRAGRRAPDRMRAVTRKLARTRGIVASWPPEHRPPSRPIRTPTRSTTSCA